MDFAGRDIVCVSSVSVFLFFELGGDGTLIPNTNVNEVAAFSKHFCTLFAPALGDW